MFTRHLTCQQIVVAIKARQEETPIPESELVQCIWQGLMASVDWSARPDQIEGLALREVGVRASPVPTGPPAVPLIF
jgi:2-keto-4-pentenoate hydratase/2-oxohepta-3-ene-1,7-dioic acid hydratase in catechol pathway